MLGLLSIDARVVSGVTEVILTEGERESTGGIAIGRAREEATGEEAVVGGGETAVETVEDRGDESVVVDMDEGDDVEVDKEVADEVMDVVVKVVEEVDAMTDTEVLVVKEATVLEGSAVVVVEVIAEMDNEGTGGVCAGGGGNVGEPMDAVREEGRLTGITGGRVAGRDCKTGEGEGEEDELIVGEADVRERESPKRMDETCKGGEVETGVPAMEVVGGRGRLDGLIPAARHCSRRDATVFFLGLDTPRPRCLDLSWASSI